jgi:hypothetical protein
VNDADPSPDVFGPRTYAADLTAAMILKPPPGPGPAVFYEGPAPVPVSAELNAAEPGEEPVWTPIDHPVVVAPRQTGKTSGYTPWLTDEEATLQLTDDERRRIIAAHREQYPDAALEVCRSILEGRLQATNREA